MKLQNIVKIDQERVKEIYKFSILNEHNVLCIGPAGCGKTVMAFQACSETNITPIYWNLSVSERVDIQGLPKTKGETSIYATPSRLPTNNNYAADKEIIEKFISENSLPLIPGRFNTNQDNSIIKELSKKLDFLSKLERSNLVKEILEKHVLETQNINILKEQIELLPKNNSNYVLIFDEADKAPPEVLQPLLEILQFKTINGTKLNIKSCILTSNLPDEHVHSEQISHAVSNRCLTIELSPNVDKWFVWAKENNIHPLIIGFLSKKDNSQFFNKRPQSTEIYNYAYPTPRSWEKCSNLLWDIENYSRSINNDHMYFQYILVASAIGDEAAKHFKVWIDCYSKLDPLIDHIFNYGNDIIINSLNLQGLTGNHAAVLEELPFDEQLICGIGVCAKYMSYIENNDDDNNIFEKTNVIFNWLYKQDKEIQTTATRAALKASVLEMKRISRIPSVNKLFLEIKNNYDRNKI